MIYDYAPFSILFRIMDSQGNDLLDQNVENNILNEDIYVLYNGKKYTLYGRPTPVVSMILPKNIDLRVESRYYNDEEITFLTFGEFSPIDNLQDATIEFHRHDGTVDNLTLSTWIPADAPGEPVWSLTYNGADIRIDWGHFITKTF